LIGDASRRLTGGLSRKVGRRRKLEIGWKVAGKVGRRRKPEIDRKVGRKIWQTMRVGG